MFLPALLIFVNIVKINIIYASAEEDHTKSGLPPKTSRLFNIFQVTKFPNELCEASNDLSGTCVSGSECNGLGGFQSGTCAQGFGICCIVSSSSCSDTITRNLTYIRNPGYPGKYSTAGDCSWKITKPSEDICQIRLDFQTMEIADPNVATDPEVGKCDADSFQGIPAQTGASTPLICGYNPGQHLYIDAGAYSTQEPSLKFTLGGNFDASWNILVSMIECSSLRLPPQGCLQYLTGTTGTVSSFNYRAGCTSHPCTHLQSQLYTVCVRQERRYCSLGWSDVDTNSAFQLSAGPSRTTAGTEYFCDTTNAPAQATNFGDYIVIPEGVDSTASPTGGCLASTPNASPTTASTNYVSKYCGARLSCIHGGAAAEVISSIKPFTLGVVFNDMERNNAFNKGFNLYYRQILC